MTWKQHLTEKVLKECWHEWEYYSPFQLGANESDYKCKKCGAWKSETRELTFDNIQDLHDVYSAVERERKWIHEGFERWVYQRYYQPDALLGYMRETTFVKWLFCLNGKPEDFEARCKMVAEWKGWKEAGDEKVYSAMHLYKLG